MPSAGMGKEGKKHVTPLMGPSRHCQALHDFLLAIGHTGDRAPKWANELLVRPEKLEGSWEQGHKVVPWIEKGFKSNTRKE